LLTNGDFESGDFIPGWSVVGSLTFVISGPFAGIAGAQSGTNWAALGNPGCCGTISQTISDAPGQTLFLSYWLAGDGASRNYFDATWNGNPIARSAVTDYDSSNKFRRFRLSVVATGSDTLVFDEQDDPNYLGLDNVNLTPVPEPGTLGLLGTALIGVMAATRRRLKTAA
jgi:hypothetical protein